MEHASALPEEMKANTDKESQCGRRAVVVSGRAVVPGGVASPGVGGNSCRAQEQLWHSFLDRLHIPLQKHTMQHSCCAQD